MRISKQIGNCNAKGEASGEQRGEGSLGRTGGAKAHYESGLAIVGAIACWMLRRATDANMVRIHVAMTSNP